MFLHGHLRHTPLAVSREAPPSCIFTWNIHIQHIVFVCEAVCDFRKLCEIMLKSVCCTARVRSRVDFISNDQDD